ncbi:MAG: ChaN family lipoprotein [Sulfuritalea sp.]|nr:ChaN family lipoprotein [Sulfuritalea sp.]
MKPAPSRSLRATLIIFLAASLLTSCATIVPGTLRDTDHPLAGRVWDASAQGFIDETELLRRAANADVLLLGEIHDNAEHHRLQLKVLKARLAAGARPALLMEQFDTDQQAALEDARRTGHDLAPLMRGWEWPQYQPLVALANTARLPLQAANLPRAATRPIVRDGYSTLPAGEMQRLALEQVWDEPRQKYMVGLIEASHCGMVTPQLRDGLVRAQRLRDATLADAALGRIDQGVVFILGRGHARRDVGVPLYLAARRPGTRVLSIGFVEVGAGKTAPAQYETERIGNSAPYDILWFTPRAERPDPCLAFRK